MSGNWYENLFGVSSQNRAQTKARKKAKKPLLLAVICGAHLAHTWRTRGAQNHEMCTTTIKSYKKHIPKKWLIYAIYGKLREDKKGENFIS